MHAAATPRYDAVSPVPRNTAMKTPEKKNGPKLPPKPSDGGAAARRRQFQLERGLPADPPEADGDKPDGTTDDEPKDQKPKA